MGLNSATWLISLVCLWPIQMDWVILLQKVLIPSKHSVQFHSSPWQSLIKAKQTNINDLISLSQLYYRFQFPIFCWNTYFSVLKTFPKLFCLLLAPMNGYSVPHSLKPERVRFISLLEMDILHIERVIMVFLYGQQLFGCFRTSAGNCRIGIWETSCFWTRSWRPEGVSPSGGTCLLPLPIV